MNDETEKEKKKIVVVDVVVVHFVEKENKQFVPQLSLFSSFSPKLRA